MRKGFGKFEWRSGKVSGWLFGIEMLWNLKNETLFLEAQLKCSAEVWGLLKHGKWRGNLPLFIWKVCGWFRGKGMKVCFKLMSGSEHAWGWTMGDKYGFCLSLLAPHTTLSWYLALILNRQWTWFGLLWTLLFANLGKIYFCTWDRVLLFGMFRIASWLPNTPQYHI